MTKNINTRLDKIEARVVKAEPEVYPADVIQLQRKNSFRGWTMFGAEPTQEIIDQHLIDTWKWHAEHQEKYIPGRQAYFQSAIDQLKKLPWPEVGQA